MKQYFIIFLISLNNILLFSACHRTDTSTATMKPGTGAPVVKEKNNKIARNTFNPGNPKPTNPNAAKEKLLDPNATNTKPQKINTSSSNAKPSNSKTTISKPGKFKAPVKKKKKNKKFMS